MLDDTYSNDLLVQGLSVYAEQEDGSLHMRVEAVDLRVRSGEWLTVVGVNGSGKSTLARVLAGLQQEGAAGTMRRGFAGAGPAAYVMQQPDAQLFGETPREELAFALEWLGTPAEEMNGRVERWLERAGLSALADEPWRRLSGGQRQLAAVAAATAGGASLVVCDEATSMLDAAAAERVMGMARELHAGGASVVWVTQRLEELTPEMRVVAMKDGRIMWDGTGREFLYGRDPHLEESPCVSCGLRLPYLAELALELGRGGALEAPLPMTATEWEKALAALPGMSGNLVISGCLDISDAPLITGNPIIPDAPVISDAPIFHQSRRTSRVFQTIQGFQVPSMPAISGADGLDRLSDRRSGASLTIGVEQQAAGTPELTLQPGTVTVLLGANGAGKTSLLETVAGLRDPGGLRIAYGDQPLWLERNGGKRKLNSQAIVRYAYGSQAPEEQLIRRTAEEELLEMLRPYRLSEPAQSGRIASALQTFGWDDSWLSRDPYRMSGGERRRLALACLFAVPALWLLIDEPTSGLDATGQELLANQLLSLRESGTGVLLVSHDSEWSLPLADRVLLLSPEGRIRDCTREELLLHPEWWQEAGMEAPAWLEAIAPLLQLGVSRDSLWHPAEHARQWTEVGSERDGEACTGQKVPVTEPSAAVDRTPSASLFLPRRKQTDRAEGSQSALTALDPRAVWLSYVLLSLAIFTQHSWLGLAASGAATIAAVLLGRIPLLRWRGLIGGYLFFTVTVSLVAGIGGGGSFASGAFLTALHSLARTFLVMVLGLGLALAITPLRLRRSLEQLLSFRGQQPFFVQRFILTVTLMLRFIPLFLSEWNRFARYAVARSKEASMTVGSVPRRLRSTALPFLLALFRLGDQVADALESRGVGQLRRKTVLRSQRWRKRDSTLVIGALAVSLALWICDL